MLAQSPATRVPSSSLKRHSLLLFLVLVFALGGIMIALVGNDPQILPFALVLAPAVVALVLAAAEGRAVLAALLRRVVEWRVHPLWYAVALGLPLVAALAINVFGVLAGAQQADLAQNLNPSLLIVFGVVLLPALAEELGWRGYALPKLLNRQPALIASVILGTFWTVFHLPLYLPGQMYAELALWPLPLIIISYSVLFTWVFKHTRYSVLVVGLFHAMLNATTPLTSGIDPTVAWELRGLILTAVAVSVAIVTGPNLGRETQAR